MPVFPRTVGNWRTEWMYCPSCSTQSIEGAKFCKSCGMNLNVVTQALNGGVVISDPVRDREYKRARKQISDGIQGSAIAGSLLAAAGLGYFLVSGNSYIYALSLALALAGIIKLFKGVGSIVDAKVGPKLLDPALQPRTSGGLIPPQPGGPSPVNVRPSGRLDPSKAPQAPNTRPVSLDETRSGPLPTGAILDNPMRPVTGRVNREHSSPLRRLEKDDDLASKLRN